MLTQMANDKLGVYPEFAKIRKHVLDDAVQLYNELIELNPGDAQVYSERASAWGLLAEYAKQKADYQTAIDLEPKNAALAHQHGPPPVRPLEPSLPRPGSGAETCQNGRSVGAQPPRFACGTRLCTRYGRAGARCDCGISRGRPP